MPQISGCLAVTFSWQQGQEIAVNVLHFRKKSGDDTPLSSSQANDVKNDLLDWINGQYRPLVAASAIMTKIAVRDLSVAPTSQTVHEFNTEFQGTATGDSMPSFVASCVTWKTLLNSRRGRGRTFLPFGTVSQVEGGLMSSQHIDNLKLFGTELLNASPPVIGRPLVVASLTDSTIRDVIGGSVGDVFDIQSRRKNRLVETRSIFPS